MIPGDPFFPEVDEQAAEAFAGEELRLLGITGALPAEEEEARFARWLGEGFHGEMGFLERHKELKFRPGRIQEGCRSILICGLNYYRKAPWPGGRFTWNREPADAGGVHGRVARYAWGRDYHKTLRKKLIRVCKALSLLYPGEEFRPFTDATPLGERYYAEQAGIGFTGRNTLLISGQYGSWMLLGEILSTRQFSPSVPGRLELKAGKDTAGKPSPHGACPSGCRRCINVCPTGALLYDEQTGGYRIDAERCISYLTIEHKGSIPEALRPLMGDWIFGCDLCQEVCPQNVRARVTEEEDFLVDRAGMGALLEELLSMPGAEAFTARFAGGPVMRTGYTGMVRNACIAAANIGARELLPLLRSRTEDPDPVIAEHAAWAVERLSGE